ncbi:hypothetical protein PUN28_008531 [Cardiocondyla obscurior]|uniref:Uncharacterized protein n=1 Tax=Cardiocondyla obscurior TaxID=286306 RepID=A0AAW2G4D2_9HYME
MNKKKKEKKKKKKSKNDRSPGPCDGISTTILAPGDALCRDTRRKSDSRRFEYRGIRLIRARNERKLNIARICGAFAHAAARATPRKIAGKPGRNRTRFAACVNPWWNGRERASERKGLKKKKGRREIEEEALEARTRVA